MARAWGEMVNDETRHPDAFMELDNIAVTNTEAPLSNISSNVTKRPVTRITRSSANTKGATEQRPLSEAHKRRRTADPISFASIMHDDKDDMKEMIMGLSNQLREMSIALENMNSALRKSEEDRIESEQRNQ
jgi:hypothetical protein